MAATLLILYTVGFAVWMSALVVGKVHASKMLAEQQAYPADALTQVENSLTPVPPLIAAGASPTRTLLPQALASGSPAK